MTVDKRIDLFGQLGEIMKLVSLDSNVPVEHKHYKFTKTLQEAIVTAEQFNGWFTHDFIMRAFEAWSSVLTIENFKTWLERYKVSDSLNDKTIAVIMAGNIPLVGFHDLLCVIISGYKIRIKLSQSDEVLMKAVINIMIELNPLLADRILFSNNKLSDFDAVIATGSNNSTRYFDYYFSKYPNIIRGNRTSVAVITGNETEEELSGLSDDICFYFGLGCRNVTHVYIPNGYDPGNLLKINEKYAEKLMLNKKYSNNYLYNKAMFHLNLEVHYDGGFMLLLETEEIHSAVAVLNYSYYEKIADVCSQWAINSISLQAIVSISEEINNAVAPGSAQYPALWEYADNVDTMEFLLSV